MIIDSSAILAILKKEPEWLAFAKLIDSADRVFLSAASYLEAAIVLDRERNSVVSASLDELIFEARIEIEAVTAEQAHLARQAYRRYGRGSGHAAHLNFGDCFSYALARAKGDSILFKGDDFVHTDVRPAMLT